jgi:methionyl-tRNA formyltransferase
VRIIFAGTPDFAAKHLDALIQANLDIVGVYTQPDRPAGRGKKLNPSAVKKRAIESDIPVFQPKSLRTQEAQDTLVALKCDLMIVVAYGLILPKTILNAPALCCVNVHASLLPRWRGAAPIQRAIEAGDELTGITIMRMDEGLDTGDIISKQVCYIDGKESSASLYRKLEEMGPPLLIQAIRKLEDGLANFEQQDDLDANYAAKIVKDEAEVDWSLPARELDRKIRAYNPFPVCSSWLGELRLKIHSATLYEPLQTSELEVLKPGQFRVKNRKWIVRCGDSFLVLEKVQLQGKQATDAASFCNGAAQLLECGQFDSRPKS